MSTETFARPGCYGSVIMHVPTRARCQACLLNKDCAAAVEVTRAKLAPLIDKTARVNRYRRTKPVGHVAPFVVPKVPPPKPKPEFAMLVRKKPGEAIAIWKKRGVEFDKWSPSYNPFVGQQKYIVVFADEIGGNKTMSRAAMIDAMRKRLIKDDGTPWSAASLISHYNIASDALASLGLIEKDATGITAKFKDAA